MNSSQAPHPGPATSPSSSPSSSPRLLPLYVRFNIMSEEVTTTEALHWWTLQLKPKMPCNRIVNTYMRLNELTSVTKLTRSNYERGRTSLRVPFVECGRSVLKGQFWKGYNFGRLGERERETPISSWQLARTGRGRWLAPNLRNTY